MVKFFENFFQRLEAAIAIEREMAACENTDLEAFFAAEVHKDGKRTKKNVKYPDESSSSSMENDYDDRIPKPPSPGKYELEFALSDHTALACTNVYV
jgi:hypothetical protein